MFSNRKNKMLTVLREDTGKGTLAGNSKASSWGSTSFLSATKWGVGGHVHTLTYANPSNRLSPCVLE